MESKILDMYFKEKMKQIDIATELGVSKYKVSRVIAKDPRNKEEKENRKIENKKKKPVREILFERFKEREDSSLLLLLQRISDPKAEVLSWKQAWYIWTEERLLTYVYCMEKSVSRCTHRCTRD